MLEADLRGFPPRLPDQPIFYPVCNEEYAAEIALKWNVPDEFSGFAGFVVRFDVNSPYADQFEEHVVGAQHHRELWVPAEELEVFNANIQDRIVVTHAYYGSKYKGPPTITNLKGIHASGQPAQLLKILNYNGMDFLGDTSTNWKAIFTNWPLWVDAPPDSLGLTETEKGRLTDAVRARWADQWPPLPESVQTTASQP